MTSNWPSTEVDGVHYEFVWQSVTPALATEVLALWAEHEALPASEDPTARLQTLMMVARLDGRIVGIATGPQVRLDGFGDGLFHELRGFVVPAVRQRHILRYLQAESFRFMEALCRDDPAVVGLYSVVESAHLRQRRAEAETRFGHNVFIGFAANGGHRRVRYFSHAAMPR